jgi:hypothetical protein
MGKLTAFILAAVAVVLATSPASARCIMSYCKEGAASSSTPTRSYIVNTHRQKVGDIYNPGHGRRLQIRDTSRRIIGYIERDGTVTNTHRQPVGTIGLD